MKPEHLPDFSIEFCKSLIEFVARIDPERWRGFPIDSFSSHLYPAHKSLYNTLRNKYNSIKKHAEDEKKLRALKRE